MRGCLKEMEFDGTEDWPPSVSRGPSGRRIVVGEEPRALPWAVLSWPCRPLGSGFAGVGEKRVANPLSILGGPATGTHPSREATEGRLALIGRSEEILLRKWDDRAGWGRSDFY